MFYVEHYGTVTIFRFDAFTIATLTAWKDTLTALYEDLGTHKQPLITLYDFRDLPCPTSRGMDYIVKIAKENPYGLARATAIVTSAHTLGIIEMAARRMPKHEVVRVFLETDRAFDWLNQFA